MRIFVAIELSEKKKEHFLSVRKSLEKVDAEVRWVKREAMHISLRFLGEVSKEKVEGVKNNLKKVLSGFGSFKVEIKGAGFFPHYVKPRIIWIGIEKTEKLKQLHQVVEDVCFIYGFEKEKRDFVAHITLGRIRSLKKKNELIQKIEEFNDFSFGEMVVKDVSLMESCLFPRGAKYICLEKMSL
ncbi:RNA 2',3'-cyclic phosphodiesterase [bacterium]|nr:RNA 2',3'-cyclic phosphodiesterase [bacterium]